MIRKHYILERLADLERTVSILEDEVYLMKHEQKTTKAKKTVKKTKKAK